MWYSHTEIEKSGYTSIFSFISDKLSVYHGFWLPFFFALGYTLLIPIIRNIIRAFYTWCQKWGESWNLDIIGKGHISMSKYLDLRSDYQTRTQILEDTIAQEKQYLNENQQIKTELLGTKSRLNDMMQNFNIQENYIRQLWDVSILNGTWENSHQYADGTLGRERIMIVNGQYSVRAEFDNNKYEFDITNFTYDNINKRVFFIKQVATHITTGGNRFNVNVLKFEGPDILVGTENGSTKIEYNRISQDA